MKYSIELIRFTAVILITFTHTKHELTDGIFYFFIEEIPKYGTVILSVISGFLYWKISKSKKSLFSKKIKSLLIPYLIANSLVLIPVLIANYFGYNFMNRLKYDFSLIPEGLLSMNSPPINPPTYFVRDIFIVFVLIELFFGKNLKMLLIIIPLLIFGKLMLRYDILILFISGIFIAEFKTKINKYIYLIISFFLSIISFLYFRQFSKYFVSIFLFVLLIDAKIIFFKTGAYSYLLHLYHSPIIVLSYPAISFFVGNPYLKIVLQILFAIIFSLLLFLITRKFKPLKILSGGR